MAATVCSLNAAEAGARLDALVDLLCDVVDGGASVSFLPPMDRALARRFWEGAISAVIERRRVLLVAEEEDALLGSVQLDLVGMPNQRHRGEVMKLLVHSRARRRGIGRMLMLALEDEARRDKRSLITLDTFTGSAGEKLYAGLGYRKAGIIPRYALLGDELIATTLMYKELSSAS